MNINFPAANDDTIVVLDNFKSRLSDRDDFAVDTLEIVAESHFGTFNQTRWVDDMFHGSGIDHAFSLREELQQTPHTPGMVQVDVGGNNIFQIFQFIFFDCFLDIRNNSRRPRLDDCRVFILDEVNRKDGIVSL